jgi:hypothetical protein
MARHGKAVSQSRARKTTAKPKPKPAPAAAVGAPDAPPEIVPDGASPGPGDQQQAPNAVIVHRIRKEDGSLEVAVGVLGDVTVDAAQSILELGIKQVRQTLGLTGS